MPRRRAKQPKSVETFTYEEARRRNLPSAEHQPSDARERSRAQSRSPTNGATATSIRNSCGGGRTSRTGQIWLSTRRHLYIQERIHPKILIDDLMTPVAERPWIGRAPNRYVRRLRRSALRGRQDRVLPTRRQLVEPHDSRRQPAGHGVPCRARGTGGQGAVHLHRSPIRHQVQFQLPMVDDQPRREGWQCRSHHP